MTRRGATINVFQLDDDPRLTAFVQELARRNGGRVFLPDAGRLGQYVVSDYLRPAERAPTASRRLSGYGSSGTAHGGGDADRQERRRRYGDQRWRRRVGQRRLVRRAALGLRLAGTSACSRSACDGRCCGSRRSGGTSRLDAAALLALVPGWPTVPSELPRGFAVVGAAGRHDQLRGRRGRTGRAGAEATERRPLVAGDQPERGGADGCDERHTAGGGRDSGRGPAERATPAVAAVGTPAHSSPVGLIVVRAIRSPCPGYPQTNHPNSGGVRIGVARPGTVGRCAPVSSPVSRARWRC